MGNKTKLQMRTDLATDLKVTIDTEITTAEANRAIDRAYSDLSRFLPDEKIHEDSLQFAVADESVIFPADTSLDAIVADEALTTSTDGDKATIDGQPDVPRPLTITLTDGDGSITGFTTIINGIDKDDQALQEIFHYTLGDSKTITGLKYFKAIFSVEFNQIDGNGAGDVFDLGYGAYTNVWVYMANSPIKWASESATDTDSNDIVRNTDFYIDYANGRVKAISGGDIVAGETSTFAYTKSQIGIDISDLPDLIRVQRVEYPVGAMPQNFVQNDVFGKYVVVTGSGESGEQELMAEDRQYRIYYDAKHQVAGEYSPGTEPSFLTDTVLMAAGAYALYTYALKQEHQAATDIASARTALGNATGTHSALALALADVEKYLDDNSGADAAGILADITTDVAELRTKIIVAQDLVNTLVDGVITDLGSANDARANYMGATANYVDGGTAPDIKKYLDDGDATLNTVATGGEGAAVPESYARYAQITKDALVAAHEQDRRFYQQNATARTNAAMAAANEVAQRLSHLRTYMEQSTGYTTIANIFNVKVGHYISQIMSYLQQASQYEAAAASDLGLADRLKAEADERRNEVYSIWRDRKQYIGDFTAGSVRQMPDYR